jgi:hypothetical protein
VEKEKKKKRRCSFGEERIDRDFRGEWKEGLQREETIERERTETDC